MRGARFAILASLLFTSCWAQEPDFVPDVVPEKPLSVLEVLYGGHAVKHGNELTPTQVKEEPTVVWCGNKGKYYTLAMTDPDVPSRENPVFGEFIHWLVANIQGSDISLGETLAEYIGAAPPLGTGLHRYVFLLYEQPGKMYFDEPRLKNTTDAGRTQFSVYRFALKYRMKQPPIAGTYFQAKYDDYVPVLNQQLSG